MTNSHAYPWGNPPKPAPKSYDDAVKFAYVYPNLRGAAK